MLFTMEIIHWTISCPQEKYFYSAFLSYIELQEFGGKGRYSLCQQKRTINETNGIEATLIFEMVFVDGF